MEYQLPSAVEKADYVEQKFNEIAPKYDLFNDLITFGAHRYWKNFLVHQLGLSEESTCLDLCCGSGDIGKRLNAKNPNGNNISLDFSEGMLQCARERQIPSAKSLFVQADALKIPLPTASVDAVTIGYGLRNVTNLQTCFQEILRVLKPGGVFASLDLGKVQMPVIQQCHHFFLYSVVPQIGKLLYPGQDMFDYLPHSSTSYPSQQQLKRQMLLEGFQQVDVHEFFFGASVIHVAHKPS